MPTRKTHILFAILLFVLLKGVLGLDIWLSVFAAVGAVLPDLDFRFMHRKTLHNVWALLAIDWVALQFGVLTPSQALAFSVGWMSHLVADSLTHMGIMPFWPVPRPKFRGMVTTGGKSEVLLMIGILVALGIVFGAVRL